MPGKWYGKGGKSGKSKRKESPGKSEPGQSQCVIKVLEWWLGGASVTFSDPKVHPYHTRRNENSRTL